MHTNETTDVILGWIDGRQTGGDIALLLEAMVFQTWKGDVDWTSVAKTVEQAQRPDAGEIATVIRRIWKVPAPDV